jgi:hypothetical protein
MFGKLQERAEKRRRNEKHVKPPIKKALRANSQGLSMVAGTGFEPMTFRL